MGHMHVDTLAKLMNTLRLPAAGGTAAAEDMWQQYQRYGRPRPLSGVNVDDQYGRLAHYTRWAQMPFIYASGELGPGSWLSPTVYSACMVPYNLGLPSPRDTVLIFNVKGVSELWGPGRAPGSPQYPDIWEGRGIEFYCPDPISLSALERVWRLEPCGGGHFV